MVGMRELPGSARIAVALLDVLAESGDFGARARALREAGVDAQGLRSNLGWIAEPVLRAMFGAASADPRLACRVGRRLLSSDGVGFFLCYGGVATVEKAYRRCDQLLARESQGSRYEAREIDKERGHVAFYPAKPEKSAKPTKKGERGQKGKGTDPLFCSLRQGMLEAIPTLFGLLPARVRELECSSKGATACVYEVRWSRTSRSGLYAGAIFGMAAGVGLALGFPLLVAAAGPASVLPVVLSLGLLGAGAGRSLDLARQLEAVAGARRGQLALLDQADRSLAEKMDELAKLRPELGPQTPADTGAGLARARAASPPAASGEEGVAQAVVRRAEQRAQGRESADLAEIVRRGVEAVRSSQPETLKLSLELEVEPAPVVCRPHQLEQVVIQLVRNAAEAMESCGLVRVGLRATSLGFEVAIEDSGPGIEPDLLDRLFDPFLEAPTAGVDSGFGLTVSYRILQEHGGHLHVASEPGQGTRVTATLPCDLRAPASGNPPPLRESSAPGRP